MSEAMWRYRGGEIGPVTAEELCQLFANGTLPLDTEVWCPAVNEWVPGRSIPGFRDAAAAAAISPPILPPVNLQAAPNFTDLVALAAGEPLPGAAQAVQSPESASEPQLRLAHAATHEPGDPPYTRFPTFTDPPATTRVSKAPLGAPPPAPKPVVVLSPDAEYVAAHPSPFDPHPRLRLLARLIDATLFMVPLALICQMAWSEVPNLVLYLGIPAIWLICEAWLLSSFGTTPGKALLGVRIQQESGRNPTFVQSMERNIFALVIAIARMTSDRPPAWTRYVELRARHGPYSVGRVVAAMLLTAGLIGGLSMFTSGARAPAQSAPVAIVPPRPAIVPAPARPAAHPAVAPEARPTLADATLDAASSRLVGTWVIRATQKTRSDTLRWTSTLILRNDGTYSQRIRASDDLDIQRDDLSQDWSGTWSMVGNTLVENVKQSTAPHHPPGRWVYAISAFNPADITMRRQAVPKNLSDSTHPIYRYHKAESVAQSQ